MSAETKPPEGYETMLDWILHPNKLGFYVKLAPDDLSAARAELAALRSKLADAEMMLRAAMDGTLHAHIDEGFRVWDERSLDFLAVATGADGLPLLTPAARSALGESR